MKKELIEKAETLLKSLGFNSNDYVISLQGPTVILSMSGQNKMKEKTREELEKIGVKII
jgi:hypothetical protein